MSEIKLIDDKYILFGAFPQNGTVKEPIRWNVLKKEDNIVTLITDKILINFMYDRLFSEYKNTIYHYRHN